MDFHTVSSSNTECGHQHALQQHHKSQAICTASCSSTDHRSLLRKLDPENEPVFISDALVCVQEKYPPELQAAVSHLALSSGLPASTSGMAIVFHLTACSTPSSEVRAGTHRGRGGVLLTGLLTRAYSACFLICSWFYHTRKANEELLVIYLLSSPRHTPALSC